MEIHIMASTKKILLFAVSVIFLVTDIVYSDNEGIPAITRPSKDVMLSFIYSGRIADVNVKEGDLVKENQLLVKQDDTVELSNLEQLKAQSDNVTQIKANNARWKQAEVDVKKYIKAQKLGSATELELEHAKLEALIAKLSLEISNFEHDQNKKKYIEAKMKVDRMKLKSPITGWIEEILVDRGEAVQGLDDVIRIVQIDPLWIDVTLVPLPLAGKLKVGQTVNVKFSNHNQKDEKGKIIFIAKHADAAGKTLKVRVEVPNKSSRPAGEHVTVIFPD